MPRIDVGSDHCRVVPLAENASLAEQIQFLRHSFAYTQAAGWLQPEARVLEVGTGEGYGANYLADAGANVIGSDLSRLALAHSARQYPRVRFLQALAQHLPFLTGAFDLVVSFQVIEHIPDASIFLDEIYRLLRPAGHFILTTPNRKMRLLPFQKPLNPYHVTEYTGLQLRRLLRHPFSHVEIAGIAANPAITAFVMAQYKQDPIRVYGGMLKKSFRRLVPNLRRSAAKSIPHASKKHPQEMIEPGAFGVQNVSLEDFHLAPDLDRALDLFAVATR